MTDNHPAKPITLWRVALQNHHRSTGATRHYKDGSVIRDVSELRIVRFPNSTECYLLYFDEAGIEMTDTLHDDIAGAMEQARFEFNVQNDEWLSCQSTK